MVSIVPAGFGPPSFDKPQTTMLGWLRSRRITSVTDRFQRALNSGEGLNLYLPIAYAKHCKVTYDEGKPPAPPPGRRPCLPC